MNKTESREKGSREPKSTTARFRLTPAELAAFESAAELAGLALSAWMRERLRHAARAELEDANLPVPFIRAHKQGR